ncbi:hypothetical protein F4775DRAFT_603977 [Biscogniauxia sp. FL1348]|nr:hypothetical protein F4775DRAFT_603977 [Biscogniauxia sp. FL1348]
MHLPQTFIALIFSASALAAPNHAKRYTSGQCGVHVQQYQKNSNGVGGEYEFTIIIKDAIGTQIGGVSMAPIADQSSYSVSSELPNQLVVSVASVDSDPVTFSYGGQIFSSSNGCSTGGYDSGSRQMDCGFSC